MAKLTRRIQNTACYDNTDPNKLPLVSAKGDKGGKATVLTAVLIDGEKGWFDEAATHGRTPIEQNVTWAEAPEKVPNGRRIDLVWLFIKPVKGEYVYHGAAASHMIIDEEAGIGYKYLANHANQLGKAVKGDVDLSELSDSAKAVLIDALNTYPDVLENSGDALKRALGIKAS